MVHSRIIKEAFRREGPGFWVHPEWEAVFPWLSQGTTQRGHRPPGESWNFTSVGGREAPGSSLAGAEASNSNPSWEALGRLLGFETVIRTPQIHGGSVLVHLPGARKEKRGSGMGEPSGADMPSARKESAADGHVTDAPGTLLSVTVADCVPVFLVDPVARAVGLLHAGWRGAAAGILEEGIRVLGDRLGCQPDRLHLHLGPAICGKCYEVGPEVYRALGLPEPSAPDLLDLRAVLAARGVALGVPASAVTCSAWCTLCDGSPFHSHRRGDKGRQVGFLGIRPGSTQDRAKGRRAGR